MCVTAVINVNVHVLSEQNLFFFLARWRHIVNLSIFYLKFTALVFVCSKITHEIEMTKLINVVLLKYICTVYCRNILNLRGSFPHFPANSSRAC